MIFTHIMLQAAQAQGSSWISTAVMILIFVVAYIFLIRAPQKKREKEQSQYLTNLKKGDQVLTVGGIYGKVYAIENDTILMEVDRGVKMKINKAYLVYEANQQAKKSAETEPKEETA